MITINKQYWPIQYLYWPIFYFQFIKKPVIAKPTPLMGYKLTELSVDEKITLPNTKLLLQTNTIKIQLKNVNDEIFIEKLLQMV